MNRRNFLATIIAAVAGAKPAKTIYSQFAGRIHRGPLTSSEPAHLLPWPKPVPAWAQRRLPLWPYVPFTKDGIKIETIHWDDYPAWATSKSQFFFDELNNIPVVTLANTIDILGLPRIKES